MYDEEYEMDVEDESDGDKVTSAGKIIGTLLTVFSLLGYVLVHADRHTTDEVNILHVFKALDRIENKVDGVNEYLRDHPREA